MDRVSYDILYIVADVALRVFIQLIGIDRLSVFNDHMGLSDLRHMGFPDVRRIVHGDRDDRAACLCGDLEGAVLEGQHAQFFTAVSRPFGENADGNPVLHIITGLQDRLEPLLGILPVEEETVEAAHPGGQ